MTKPTLPFGRQAIPIISYTVGINIDKIIYRDLTLSIFSIDNTTLSRRHTDCISYSAIFSNSYISLLGDWLSALVQMKKMAS